MLNNQLMVVLKVHSKMRAPTFYGKLACLNARCYSRSSEFLVDGSVDSDGRPFDRMVIRFMMEDRSEGTSENRLAAPPLRLQDFASFMLFGNKLTFGLLVLCFI